MPADIGTCAQKPLPPPPSQADMDAFHADAHFLNAFARAGQIERYTVHGLHGDVRNGNHLNTSHRVLHLGDGQGYMPCLSQPGTPRQVAVDGHPRSPDHPEADVRCSSASGRRQQTFSSPQRRAPRLDATATQLQRTSSTRTGQPWPTMRQGRLRSDQVLGT